eukprot:5847881-Pleurochrysis_carterae.AAC.2
MMTRVLRKNKQHLKLQYSKCTILVKIEEQFAVAKLCAHLPQLQLRLLSVDAPLQSSLFLRESMTHIADAMPSGLLFQNLGVRLPEFSKQAEAANGSVSRLVLGDDVIAPAPPDSVSCIPVLLKDASDAVPMLLIQAHCETDTKGVGAEKAGVTQSSDTPTTAEANPIMMRKEQRRRRQDRRWCARDGGVGGKREDGAREMRPRQRKDPRWCAPAGMAAPAARSQMVCKRR